MEGASAVAGDGASAQSGAGGGAEPRAGGGAGAGGENWPEGTAGIVLAGGRSSRMGRPKAALDWHGSTLLYRTAAVLGRVVSGPVVVVAAPGQALRPLPAGVEVVTDPVEGRGPMQGIATGLTAVAGRSRAAFVSSTDLPFLHPAFVTAVLRPMLASKEALDVVLPTVGGFRQPLAAAYRSAMAEFVQSRVAAGDLRPGLLFRRCRVRELDDTALLADPALARLDPDLDSVVNVNDPETYAAARRRPPPEVTVAVEGAGASASAGDPRRVRAATLGRAAGEAGVALGAVIVAVNGNRVPSDPQLPLVSGDAVSFAVRTAPP